jgi:excisionase family DNA binding protein
MTTGGEGQDLGNDDGHEGPSSPDQSSAAPAREHLVLSIRDVAKMLGVSDDLVYELVARGEIPCLRLGRRRLVPRRAVELMIERSLETFDRDLAARQPELGRR